MAFADYRVGAPGVHPYTDARTAGLNMIDAVRALRHTYPDVSTNGPRSAVRRAAAPHGRPPSRPGRMPRN